MGQGWLGGVGVLGVLSLTCLPQAGGDDARAYRAVEEAMAVIGFTPEEVGAVRRILAAILHLVRVPGKPYGH